MRYATRRDAIEQVIAPALDSGDYDMMAICYETFEYRYDVNGRGQDLLDTGGFEQVVFGERFWRVVARHAR